MGFATTNVQYLMLTALFLSASHRLLCNWDIDLLIAHTVPLAAVYFLSLDLGIY